MIIKNNECKRLAIYFFFDKFGIVDRYIPYFLNDLNQNVDKTIIVVNGKLNNAGKETLSNYGEVIVRENKGFDVWAYKTALEYVGWDNLEEYDEIVLLNSTILGPIYPLKESFEKMSQSNYFLWLQMFFLSPFRHIQRKIKKGAEYLSVPHLCEIIPFYLGSTAQLYGRSPLGA